jgi:hypothetical protein
MVTELAKRVLAVYRAFLRGDPAFICIELGYRSSAKPLRHIGHFDRWLGMPYDGMNALAKRARNPGGFLSRTESSNEGPPPSLLAWRDLSSVSPSTARYLGESELSSVRAPKNLQVGSSNLLGDPPPDPRFLASLGMRWRVKVHHCCVVGLFIVWAAGPFVCHW